MLTIVCSEMNPYKVRVEFSKTIHAAWASPCPTLSAKAEPTCKQAISAQCTLLCNHKCAVEFNLINEINEQGSIIQPLKYQAQAMSNIAFQERILMQS